MKNNEQPTESYGLNWVGKAACMQSVHPPTAASLVDCREESVNFDETKNIFIEGDNLDALKLLQESLAGQIKMIYIDPPYNTGTVRHYPDRFWTSRKDKHSNWLNMMYPRLYLARNLLKEDGVIFISIDDHEQANLKALCDLVFGEENFVGTLLWKRRASSAMANSNLSIDHEYVVAYRKDSFSHFKGLTKKFDKYGNKDNDPRGEWISGDLTIGMTASMRPNQAYNLVNPADGKIYPFNPNRVWAYAPESMKKMIQEGRIIFPHKISSKPMQKRFKDDLKSSQNPFSSIMTDIVGLNTEGTKVMQLIMGGNIFDYSKPISLIKNLINQATQPNDIILDFFAGSSTTAHAVMQLNTEDNANRRYIMVQLPEHCKEDSEAYKAGYKTIADLSKERIRRAAKKIAESSPDKASLVDLGFKVRKIVHPAASQ